MRLIVVCLLGPVDIALSCLVAWKFFEGPGNLIFRLVGGNVGLQRKSSYIFSDRILKLLEETIYFLQRRLRHTLQYSCILIYVISFFLLFVGFHFSVYMLLGIYPEQ